MSGALVLAVCVVCVSVSYHRLVLVDVEPADGLCDGRGVERRRQAGQLQREREQQPDSGTVDSGQRTANSR